MSQIQTLPKDILANITPHLVSGEAVKQALLQDNKKPNIIWLISTNQAIILHGQQEPNSKPIIMVYALDEIKEIDYLQKNDDIQVIIYSGVNTGKAVFHFEISAKSEVEKFFLEFGDLITFRFINDKGKIEVVQRALPIGDKERHKFGRGKKLEEKAKVEASTIKDPKQESTSASKEPAKAIEKQTETAPKAETIKPKAQENNPKQTTIEQKLAANIQKKAAEQKTAVASKTQADNEQKSTVGTKAPVTIPPRQVTDGKPQETKPAANKEIDYGNPVFFIGVTIIATAVGFFCLSFFKTISKIVKYFKNH